MSSRTAAAPNLLAAYIAAMTNAFGVVLDDASVRRADETVIAAIYLLHERSVDQVGSRPASNQGVY